MKWSSHINFVCNNLSSTSYLMSQFAKYKNSCLLKLLYNGLVESRLRYGLPVWGSAPQYLLKRVFVNQKRIVRIMAGLKPRVSCKDKFKELGILTFPSLYIYETIIYAKYNSLGGTDGTAVHEYNTRSCINLRQTPHRSSLAAGLPQNAGARFFWKLPDEIKNTPSKNCFKNKLKEYLICGGFYSVGEFMLA